MSAIDGLGSSVYNSMFTSNTANNIFNLQQSLTTASYFKGYGVNNSSLSASQSSSVVSFKNSADTLLKAVSTLMGKKTDGSSIFGDFAAKSADTDALTATYNSNIGKYSSEALLARRDPNYKPANPTDVAVKTLQLATTQQNKSDALNANEKALEPNKTYRFEIESGGKTTSLAFVSEAGDTNKTVQEKMAKAINEKDIGVSAKVVYDSAKGTSSLLLESKETGLEEGKQNSFEIRDVAGYDAVERLGAGNVTQAAQNAIFAVGEVDTAKSTKDNIVFKGDVEQFESMSNEIVINDKTNVTLKKVTDDYTRISYENSDTAGINAVRELVNGFNALYDAARSNADSSVHSRSLANRLINAAETYGGALYGLGIDRDENGYLTIDEDKMKEAAESGRLADFFSSEDQGQSYGFVNRLNTIAKSVEDNPTQYVKEEAASLDPSSADYWESTSSPTNYSKLFFNLQKYENMGALFNSMF